MVNCIFGSIIRQVMVILSDFVSTVQNPNLRLSDVIQRLNWDPVQLEDLVGISIVPNIILYRLRL